MFYDVVSRAAIDIANSAATNCLRDRDNAAGRGNNAERQPFRNCVPGTELLQSTFRMAFSMGSLSQQYRRSLRRHRRFLRSHRRSLRHCRDPWGDRRRYSQQCQSLRDSLNIVFTSCTLVKHCDTSWTTCKTSWNTLETLWYALKNIRALILRSMRRHWRWVRQHRCSAVLENKQLSVWDLSLLELYRKK